jgi:hypothetical protein
MFALNFTNRDVQRCPAGRQCVDHLAAQHALLLDALHVDQRRSAGAIRLWFDAWCKSPFQTRSTGNLRRIRPAEVLPAGASL